MDIVLTIIGIIALSSFAILCWKLIVFLRKFGDFLEETTTSIQAIERRIVNLESKLEPIMLKAGNTFELLDKQLTITNETVELVYQMVSRVSALHEQIQSKIEPPLLHGATLISGTLKAAFTFLKELRK